MFNLKRVRIESGLTQFELSLRSGISIPLIQKIEYGDGNPSLKTLELLCGALDLDIEFKKRHGNWDRLTQLGAPLAGSKNAVVDKNETNLLREIILLKDETKDDRQNDAYNALLFAIKDHFQSTWRKLAKIGIKLKGLPTPKQIKLRRIAVAVLAEYL